MQGITDTAAHITGIVDGIDTEIIQTIFLRHTIITDGLPITLAWLAKTQPRVVVVHLIHTKCITPIVVITDAALELYLSNMTQQQTRKSFILPGLSISKQQCLIIHTQHHAFYLSQS